MDEEIIESDVSANENEENKSGISADLIRGHINTIILRTLYDRDKYGYEIIEEIESKSKGQYSLKQPTLYSALKRLESQGYINAYWKTDEVSQGGRRKYYTLTESGKFITEKNQAEWEYSRSVIDNLISDRSFDFSQPPPAQVDMKILKNSTSRVPVVKDETETEKAEIIEKVAAAPVLEVTPPQPVARGEERAEQQPAPAAPPAPAPLPEAKADERSEEERKILHENYLKLIHNTDKNAGQAPYADNIDTQRLIYNNKPETERDYRNLIGNLFDKTITNNHSYTAIPDVVSAQYDADEPQQNDAFSINVSEYKKNDGAKRATYNKYGVLFKTSLIVFAIMIFEFALSIIFKNDLGVSWGYPFVIFVLGAVQLAIFGILRVTDTGKASRKPVGHTYLTSAIILSIILIVVIFLIAALLNVDFSSVGDIFAKIVIPCVVALNVPVFACIFYLFSK